MTTIEFVSSISDDMRETILGRLRTLEAERNVRILFAVESGSRAWGFPSPDSDYDARFVYARPEDWYLSVSPGRDVIELPIEGGLDINGWDIKKALGLLLKPNPALLEWLSSPIRYRWDDEICARIGALSKNVAHGIPCIHHYLGLGESLWRRHIADKEPVNIKNYFYVVRPALALRWVRTRPDEMLPMNLQELLRGVDVSIDLTSALQELLVVKSRARELGEGPRIAVIDAFVSSEFALAHDAVRGLKTKRRDLRPDADALFRAIVRGTS